MRRFVASVTLLLVALVASAQTQIVNVPDPTLNALLRERLFLSGTTPITQSDMLRLPEVLVLNGTNIRNLQGMQFATGVRELVIENGLIATFEPLGGLRNLTHLDLSGNPIISIAPVRQMIALTTLQIDSMTPGVLRSLCPLLNHPSLEVVSFINQNIFDVCPLGSLINLTDANLAENPIGNIAALTDSPFLTDPGDTEFFSFRDTNLDNFDCQVIEFLLDNSVRLDLSGTTVTCTTFPPIKGTGPTSLPDCSCGSGGEGEGEGEGEGCSDGEVAFSDPALEDAVRDALGIASGTLTAVDMEGLVELVAIQRGIDSLSGLQCAVNLETLVVPRNAIRSLTPIEDLTQLRELDISANDVVSLAPILGMIRLRTLVASGNPAPDISPLALSLALEEVDLEAMGIVDIGVLQDLPVLNRIDLAANPIVSVDPLVNNPGLGPGDRVNLIGTLVRGAECGDLAQLADRGVLVLAPGACVMGGNGGGCPNGSSKDGSDGSNGVGAAAFTLLAVSAVRRRRTIR